MRFNKWIYGALALGMMAACSEDNFNDSPNPGSGEFQTTSGEGYLGISLQLPEQPSTRSNDVFDDGLPAEYNVKNAALLLFWGDENKEEDAEFIGAYVIGSDERFEQPNGDNITTSFQNVATLNKKIAKVEGKQLWGLAIVNYDDKIFKIGDGDSSSPNYGTLKVKAKTIEPTTETLSEAEDIEITVKKENSKPDANDAVAGMKFSDFRLLVTDQPLYDTSGGLKIFMTNAPLCDSEGETVSPNAGNSGYTIQTLTKLDVEKIFDVKETAKVNPAGCIFVERAVAKVTLSSFPLTSTLKYQKLTQTDDGTIVAEGDPEEVTLKIKSLGWLLDNEETDSYIIRNSKTKEGNDDIWTLSNSNKYRFVGGSKMNTPVEDNEFITTNHQWYRTYWCKDPHYAKGKDFNPQATVESVYVDLIKDSQLNTEVVLYPRENTFSVQYQDYKNTTRVVFRVQYEWKDDEGRNLNVYCKAGDPSIIYKKNDAQKFILSPFISSNTIHDFVLNNVDGEKAITNGIGTANDFGGYNIKYGIDDFKFVFETVDTEADGKLLQMTEVTLKEDGNLFKSLKDGVDQNTIQKALEEALTDANQEVKIRSFADETNGNVCFYATNIKHFGDTYCPMPQDAAGNPTYKGITTDVVYPDYNNGKYLGRWGMVRNNWYDLSIGVINNMGYADVPNGDVNTSDDNNKEEYYLSAKVHVLSWAKRTQNVNF